MSIIIFDDLEIADDSGRFGVVVYGGETKDALSFELD